MLKTNKDSPFYDPSMEKVVEAANKVDLSTKKAVYHNNIDKGFFSDMTTKHKQSPLGLYLFLKEYVWRNHHPKDIYKLHRYYITGGIMVASFPMDKLVEIFNKDKATINRWLKSLRDEGYLEYGDKVGPRHQNTYVLGYVEDGKDVFYADVI